MKLIPKLWFGLGVMILLSPLGIFIPAYLKAGSAWGEWGADEIGKLAGYIPKGLERVSSLWSAPIPDYAFKGWGEKGLGRLSFAYILSALIGILVITGVVLLLGKLLSKKE